jgi:hypothetical protein
MANVPPAQPLFEAARQLELSKIPLFFGDPAKDHFTPETWLSRLEQARAIGNWNAANTAIYMNMSFREKAIEWRDGIKGMGVNTDDFDALRTAFLRFYNPGATIRSCVANLDLKQGASESVRDFGPRVARVIHDIKQSAQAYVFPARAQLFAAPIVGLQGYDALADNVVNEAHMAVVNIGQQRLSDLFSIHIFIAGLKPYLRDKCITRVFNTYYEAYTHATSLEHNMSDPKKSAHVFNLEETDPQSDSDETDEQIEAQVNRLQARLLNRRSGNNRRGRGNRTNRSGPRRDLSNYTCHYCNIRGHLQADCRKRKAAGAPMVSQNHSVKSVHNTEGTPSVAGAPTSETMAPTAPAIVYNPYATDPALNNIYNPHLNFY